MTDRGQAEFIADHPKQSPTFVGTMASIGLLLVVITPCVAMHTLVDMMAFSTT